MFLRLPFRVNGRSWGVCKEQEQTGACGGKLAEAIVARVQVSYGVCGADFVCWFGVLHSRW